MLPGLQRTRKIATGVASTIELIQIECFHIHLPAMMSIKHIIFEYYGWIALVLFGALVGLSVWVGGDHAWKIFIASVTASLSFVYFAQKQKLEELRLFRELFEHFNQRYERLNHALISLMKRQDQDLNEEEKQVFYDYFNLCGEEFLFYRKGYIYPEVWTAWQNGMKVYAADPSIQELWQRELESNSYYGFSLALLGRIK